MNIDTDFQSKQENSRPAGKIEAGYRNKWAMISLVGFCAISCLTLLGGIAAMIYFGWKPYRSYVDFLIGFLVVSAAIGVVYVFHYGRKLLHISLFFLLIVGFLEKTTGVNHLNFIAGTAIQYVYVPIFIYSISIFLIFCIHGIFRLLSTAIVLSTDGIYVAYASNKTIPWDAIDEIDEIKQYDAPAFVLKINKNSGIKTRIINKLYEKNPSISAKKIDIDPDVLRSILFSRGNYLNPI